MRVDVEDRKFGRLEPHYFNRGGGTKLDRFGRQEGYRCSPPGLGRNTSRTGICFRTVDELADHLLANPGWGICVKKPGHPASLRYTNIIVDGRPL
ncbi:hypothetical protein SAMN05877838_3607 [Hoeflea halophila]|uniref:Uncharacterized protein n=1 Tax=Hoeflea halophila TaxID=714899 RepID=A0A286IF39_9HYPH|nr:hypothetical protein SAMN05877838_3607 [Hoeflea halophila]